VVVFSEKENEIVIKAKQWVEALFQNKLKEDYCEKQKNKKNFECSSYCAYSFFYDTSSKHTCKCGKLQ
jgi:hypothetical protein